MSLTQDQWFQKLKKFVPNWWFEKYKYSPALFQGIASAMMQLQADGEDQFNAVFLTNETTPILDLSGSEVGKPRISGENDPSYVVRIQRISNQSDAPDIKSIVDSLLIVPGCKIQSSPIDNSYCNRKFSASRDNYLCGFLQNFFIIIVPKQIHIPYSFTSRRFFDNRLAFAGSNVDPTQQFTSIIQQVNDSISFGVMYSIVESTKFVVV